MTVQLIDTPLGIKKIRQYLIFSIVIYIIIALYYTCTDYKEPIPLYLEQARIIVTAYYILAILLCFYRISARNLLIFNAIMALVCVINVKMVYEVAHVNIFGGAVDANKYFNETINFAHLSFSEFQERLYNNGFDIHDMGNFSLHYIVYNIYPDQRFLVYGVAVVNVIFLYVSSVFLFKLCRMFDFNLIISKLCTILYAASPYAMLTIANGLKEVYFNLFVIMAMYFLCKAYRGHAFKNLLFAIPFIYGVNLFRGAVFYMFVLVAFVSLTANYKHKKSYLLFIFISAIVGFYFLPMILDTFMGRSQELADQIVTFRFRGRIDGFMSSMLPSIAGFFGPFPNLDRLGTSGLVFVASLAMFVKSILSLWFVIGVYKIVTHYKAEYYGMLVYVLSTILMLMQSGVTLDMRFHFTYLPFFFPICFIGFNKQAYINYGYLMIIITFIILYASRSVFSGTA